MKNNFETFDRQALYDLVWSEPVSKLSLRYGLSDVGFAKICKGMGIPLPGRGHWARVDAGQSVRRPILPKARVKQPLEVRFRRLDDAAQTALSLARQKAATAKKAASGIRCATELIDAHPLVRTAVSRLQRKTGWDSQKGLRSAPGEVLHIEVTEAAIDRAALILDSVLKEVEKLSGTVKVDKEAKKTLIHLDDVDVELTLTEHVKRIKHEPSTEETKARERYWKNHNVGYPHIPDFDWIPTGQLTLTVGRWPSRTWKDTDKTSLHERLHEVVAGIVAVAAATKAREEQEARSREARRLAEEMYVARMKERAEERSAFIHLKHEARRWVLANQLRAYVDVVEAGQHPVRRQLPNLADWLQWARQKADWLDPLIVVSDVVLDAPEPVKPGYW